MGNLDRTQVPSKASGSVQVLVVEDDQEIRDLISGQLRREQYGVQEAKNGREALEHLKDQNFDLLVLDWMLPDVEGVQIASVVKATPQHHHPASGKETPILMVTAKSTPQDIIHGLESGADDYITKPFDLLVFRARIRALLRRVQKDEDLKKGADGEVQLNDMKINFESHQVFIGGEEIQLTLSEFKLLSALVKNRGKVLTRDRLIALVQGEGVAVIDRTVDTHIFGLRKKLESCSDLIETVRGVGYRIASF